MICDYGFARVVVDSLTQFESCPSVAEHARVRFEWVVNTLRFQDLSVLMTRETEMREAPFREAPFRATPEEHLADTIVQMEYRRLGDARDGRRVRLLEVLKIVVPPIRLPRTLLKSVPAVCIFKSRLPSNNLTANNLTAWRLYYPYVS
jgi:KaiC/GvpD/RAD55 family RecA-like ATPase